MTINQTLRIPEILAARLDRVANETGRSRHQVIIDTLTTQHLPDADDLLDLDLVIGFVEAHNGEIIGEDCPECGQPMDRPHIGFTVGATHPQTFGPVCAACASTD
jgi:predicted transcriptional regulator